MSIIFPNFGTPQVFNDRLVFTGPGRETKELICIERERGKLLWREQFDDTIRATRAGSCLFIASGNKVFSCDVSNGATHPFFESNLAGTLRLSDAGSETLLVSGERGELIAVDVVTGKRLWTLPDIEIPPSQQTEMLLLVSGQREGAQSRLTDPAVLAVERRSGRILWRRGFENFFPEPAVVGTNVVVATDGKLLVLDQSGKEIAVTRVSENEFGSVAFTEYKESILVAASETGDSLKGFVLYSYSLPDLRRTVLFKPDWYAANLHVIDDLLVFSTIGRMDAYSLTSRKKVWRTGHGSWQGVYDGSIYLSQMDKGGKSTSISRVNVKNGRRVRLFREDLPESLRFNRTQP